MAEDNKAPWLNWLALTTILFAVAATLSTFKAAGYSTRAILQQSKAANEWAHFQAKSIKGYQYEIGKEKLTLELKAMGPKVSPDVKTDYEKTIKTYEDKMTRYESEKTEIQKSAKSFETVARDAQSHGQPFGLAVIYLQMAILLSSIAALLKKPALWWAGVALGEVGLVYFANGFWLFMH